MALGRAFTIDFLRGGVIPMPWQEYLDKEQSRFLDELIEFLSIPSISTIPSQASEVRRAVQWVHHRLQTAGFDDVRVLETAGHPVAFAQWLKAPDAPTILVYGHCDVQPVDPLSLWNSPPFEPTIRDGRIYARGASDMKTSALTVIAACEAWLKGVGSLPINVKVLVEAEEEIGSPNLEKFVLEHKDLLASHLVVSADSGQSDGGPLLPYGVRGLVGLQIDITSAKTDLHSGMGGGIAPNANHELIRLLDSMRGEDGTILVPGFYDSVAPLDSDEAARIAAGGDWVSEFAKHSGIRRIVGVPHFTPAQRAVARPTLEVNGMWGGFQEDGIKTVIPCEAHAKVTCRLVPNQTPDEVYALLKAHIETHVSDAVSVKLTRLPGSALPYLLPLDHPGARASVRALKRVYSGKEPVPTRSGGTVPFLGMMLRHLGVHTVSYGFSGDNENIHAPNEFFKLPNFALGQRGFCMLFEELARM